MGMKSRYHFQDWGRYGEWLKWIQDNEVMKMFYISILLMVALLNFYFQWMNFMSYILIMLNMSFINALSFSSLFEKQRLIYIYWSFLGGSVVKESTSQCRTLKRCGFDLWVRKIPWSRKWQYIYGKEITSKHSKWTNTLITH